MDDLRRLRRFLEELQYHWFKAEELLHEGRGTRDLLCLDDVREHRHAVEQALESGIRECQRMVEDWERALYDLSRELDKPFSRLELRREETTQPHRTVTEEF